MPVPLRQIVQTRRERRINDHPCLLSFSGIDGAGKTTQINAVLNWLREAGYRTQLLQFWDDVAVLGRVRATASHKLFKSEQGVGTEGKPVQRQDKNVRGWYMTLLRLCLYLLDAAQLAYVVAKTSREKPDVIVFDRYLYDELANLDLGRLIPRLYARLLLWIVPRPGAAFILDADPDKARARKPEYPIDFVRTNRASYLRVAELAEGIIVVPALNAADVTQVVLRHVGVLLASQEPSTRSSMVYPPESSDIPRLTSRTG
jgi:thymidylate kinase